MVPEAAAGMRSGIACARRSQEHVDDALRSFDIASGHGCGRLGVDHGSGRGDDADGSHESGGGGHIFAQQAAEDVEAGRVGDGFDGIDGALDLRVAAGEVDGTTGAFSREARDA